MTELEPHPIETRPFVAAGERVSGLQIPWLEVHAVAPFEGPFEGPFVAHGEALGDCCGS